VGKESECETFYSGVFLTLYFVLVCCLIKKKMCGKYCHLGRI
jgi:hypothetical protein